MPNYEWPSIAYIALAAVLIAAIAAIVVYAVARLAITKARAEDVPQVLSGLTGLVDGFAALLPYPKVGHDDAPAQHDEDAGNRAHAEASKMVMALHHHREQL